MRTKYTYICVHYPRHLFCCSLKLPLSPFQYIGVFLINYFWSIYGSNSILFGVFSLLSFNRLKLRLCILRMFMCWRAHLTMCDDKVRLKKAKKCRPLIVSAGSAVAILVLLLLLVAALIAALLLLLALFLGNAAEARRVATAAAGAHREF